MCLSVVRIFRLKFNLQLKPWDAVCRKTMFSVMSVYQSVYKGSSCVHYPWCHWSVTGDMGPPPPTCLNLFTWNPSVHLVSVWVDEISTNLTTLYDVVTTLSVWVDEIRTNLTTLYDVVTTLSVWVDEISTNLTTLYDVVMMLSVWVDEISTNLTTLYDVVTTLSVWVDEIRTNLTTLYDVVTRLSQQVANMTKNFEEVTKEVEETKKKLNATEEKLKTGKIIPTKRYLFTTTKRSVNQSELSTLPAGWKLNHINTVPVFDSFRRCVQCSAVRRRFLPAWRTGHIQQRHQ